MPSEAPSGQKTRKGKQPYILKLMSWRFQTENKTKFQNNRVYDYHTESGERLIKCLYRHRFTIFLSWRVEIAIIEDQIVAHASRDSPIVIRSPRESAIPCVLLRIRTWPVIVPASVRSTLRFANASSPIKHDESQTAIYN